MFPLRSIVKIRLGDILETNRPGFQQKEIRVKAYAPERRLFMVTVLTEYLRRTKPLRKSTRLLMSTTQPHGHFSRDTISSWVKTLMNKARLDLGILTPYTARAASTSALVRAKIPLHSILETAV